MKINVQKTLEEFRNRQRDEELPKFRTKNKAERQRKEE